MPTPSEQKALAFLATVIVLAGALRLARSNSQPAASVQEQHALADQLSAVDSAANSNPRKGRKGRKSARRSSDTDSMLARSAQAVPSYQTPPVYQPEQTLPQRQPYAPGPAYSAAPGYAPPQRYASQPPYSPSQPSSAPIAESRPTGRRTNRLTQVTPVNPSTGRPEPLDLDQATAEQIDQLPRVGPAISARIVANRDSFGPFGSILALKRVKGMGPATLKRLAPLVTFSGRPASSASRVPYY